ncbi:MAG: hypothetical protein MUF81_09480 [Verrucomicrobia bacterium]|nr:hypothetical protein [Verrucomicrobiota bacterium]
MPEVRRESQPKKMFLVIVLFPCAGSAARIQLQSIACQRMKISNGCVGKQFLIRWRKRESNVTGSGEGNQVSRSETIFRPSRRAGPFRLKVSKFPRTPWATAPGKNLKSAQADNCAAVEKLCDGEQLQVGLGHFTSISPLNVGIRQKK